MVKGFEVLVVKAVIMIFLMFFLFSCSEESFSDENKIENAEKEYSSPDYYDFSSEKDINNLGTFKISPFLDKIIFNPQHGNIEDPLRYYNNFDNFNFNGIYKIEDPNGSNFYFRFGWVDSKDGITTFSNVKWLVNRPPEGEKFYYISTVEIDFIQKGEIKVSTIGDSQTWWQDAQNLRRYLDHYFEDLIFVGSNTDVNGYGHDGEGGNETEEVLNRFEEIPKADFYTVLLGTNDYKDNPDKAFNNLKTLFNKIHEKFPEAIIMYVSPLPSAAENRNSFNETLSGRIVEDIMEKDYIRFIDVKNVIMENPDWLNDFYVGDGLHMNNEGVDILAKEISKNIKEYIETIE